MKAIEAEYYTYIRGAHTANRRRDYLADPETKARVEEIVDRFLEGKLEATVIRAIHLEQGAVEGKPEAWTILEFRKRKDKKTRRWITSSAPVKPTKKHILAACVRHAGGQLGEEEEERKLVIGLVFCDGSAIELPWKAPRGYAGKKVPELKVIAKARGILEAETMKKAELIAALQAKDEAEK